MHWKMPIVNLPRPCILQDVPDRHLGRLTPGGPIGRMLRDLPDPAAIRPDDSKILLHVLRCALAVQWMLARGRGVEVGRDHLALDHGDHPV